MPSTIPSYRFRPGSDDHHLWNNNGTWWFHLTFHLPGYLKHRFRTSLRTKDHVEAQQLRDALLALFGIDPRLRPLPLTRRPAAKEVA